MAQQDSYDEQELHELRITHRQAIDRLHEASVGWDGDTLRRGLRTIQNLNLRIVEIDALLHGAGHAPKGVRVRRTRKTGKRAEVVHGC